MDLFFERLSEELFEEYVCRRVDCFWNIDGIADVDRDCHAGIQDSKNRELRLAKLPVLVSEQVTQIRTHPIAACQLKTRGTS